MAIVDNALNFIKAVDPRKLNLPKTLAQGLIPLGIFITGYSAPPAGYVEPTQRYVEGFVDSIRAQGNAPVLITSPTVTPGSIDAIGTEVAHKKKTDILYITAGEFLSYVDANQLSETADKKRFIETPKYYFDNKQDYSLASAIACDVTEVTGGRDTAVRDFENAIQENRKVVLVHNSRLPTGFDTEKRRPNNAEEYIESMIHASIDGQDLPYPAVNGLDASYLKRNRDVLMRVRIDNVDTPAYLLAPTVKDLWASSTSDITSSASTPEERDMNKPVEPGILPPTLKV